MFPSIIFNFHRYWLREGNYIYFQSCLDIMYQSYFDSDEYITEPKKGDKRVKTYCDFDSYGGGWTLLSTTSNGVLIDWKESKTPMEQEFSQLKYVDILTHKDVAEVYSYILVPV